MTKAKLLKLVRNLLADVGHGIVFDIIEAGVRREDSWWYVPVIAERKGNEVPREVTVNIYANLETDLEEEHGVTVLFVPMIRESTVSL